MKITYCLPANINSLRVAVHGSLSSKVIAEANKRDDSRGIRSNAFTIGPNRTRIDRCPELRRITRGGQGRPIFGQPAHKSLLFDESTGRPQSRQPRFRTPSYCSITHVPLKNVLLTFFRGIPGLPAWKFDRRQSWARGEGQVHQSASMIRT